MRIRRRRNAKAKYLGKAGALTDLIEDWASSRQRSDRRGRAITRPSRPWRTRWARAAPRGGHQARAAALCRALDLTLTGRGRAWGTLHQLRACGSIERSFIRSASPGDGMRSKADFHIFTAINTRRITGAFDEERST